MKKGIYRKLALNMFLAALLTIFIGGFSITAEAAEDKEQTMDILLKENADIDKVTEEIKEQDEKIQIEVCEDINLLHLIYPESVDVEEIVQDKSIRGQIEVTGDLPKIEDPKDDLSDVDVSDITPESEEMAEEEIDDYDLFDMLAWHLDEVTDDRQSLEYTTGKGVRIAHIDSGVDTTHPVLAGKLDLARGKSYVDGDDSLTDYHSHGTETAGVIAQIAPDATITPYKVMNATDGESRWTLAAIVDAVNDGNDVINLSLGTYKCVDDCDERILVAAYKRAIRYAQNNGVAVFASSGNKGIDLDQNYESNKVLHLPGEIKGVNTISSVWNGSEASYSNYGSCVEFCAPGGDLVYTDGLLDLTAFIYVTFPTYIDNGLETIGVPQGYTVSYGTSLSSAIATACFADIYSYGKEKHPYFQIDDALDLMMAGSNDLGEEGKDVHYGNGEINILKAIGETEPRYKGEVTEESEKSRTYRNHRITTDYNVTEEYGDTYHVDVTITNNTESTIHKWEVEMDLEDEIDQIWDAKARKDGDRTILSGEDYDQDIDSGESVSFGFIAKKASSEDEINLPEEVILVNAKYMIKPEDYSVELDISSSWGSGFVGNVTITNLSDHAISDWKLEFTYDADIESIWNASIAEKDDDYYSILNDGSNQNIPAGESVTFGFEAAGTGEEEIGNVSLISITK
ncbi:cellulose binding domain-containing protein [Butyrivibrio sp. INlla21]|uniref:cellulose binding domain-containing protein n=1 Tax=Butyrivibrio sp. INlla21 TaxID=1520811 RepID=UPI0008E38364|nr:S8 family serine peptidase [Butyrivibrio sp. INlla21]SFU96346.1 Serine protease, subtilisin family [Butyrivibrio sp. INlla21]